MTATITAAQVKELREATQAGMMDAKKALVETGGDFDAAVKLLREKGIAKAGKLGARDTTEGRVALAKAIDETDEAAALVLVGCNTDFVAKNDDFGAFVQKVAEHALRHGSTDVEHLLAQEWADGGTVEEARMEASSSTGENIAIAKVARFDATGTGVLGTYLHGTGIGVIVDVEGPATDEVLTFANDVAMHVAAASPRFLTREEVPQADVDAERDIFVKQMEGDSKPDEIKAKIAEGKLNKWYSEIVLLEQGWIFAKDRVGKDLTIGEYAKQTGATIRGFARFGVKG
jgi:elongation factor Ts